MFVRVKKVGPYQYLQIAENHREGKRVKQTIIATVGSINSPLPAPSTNSCARLGSPSASWRTLRDAAPRQRRLDLIFERLWRETGCQEVVRKLLATRHHHFDVERRCS